MVKNLVKKTLFIFSLLVLLWSQQTSYLNQKITIENSLRDKVSTAIGRIIEKDKFVVTVNVEFAIAGGAMPKTTTQQSGQGTADGYSPIPGLPTVPSTTGSTPTRDSRRKKGSEPEYNIGRVDVTVFLDETLASGSATQEIKSLVEKIIPETQDCTDCVKIETMRFHPSQREKEYAKLEKQIEDLEEKRRQAELDTEELRLLDITRQLDEAETARKKWEDQARTWELYRIKEDSIRLARLLEAESTRKKHDSIRFTNTEERLKKVMDSRIRSDSVIISETMSIVKQQSGIGTGDDESLLGMQVGSGGSGFIGPTILVLLIIGLVGLSFLAARNKKPQTVYLKPKSKGEGKKKKETKTKNSSDEEGEEVKPEEPPPPPPPVTPPPTRADEDALRSELRSLRQSAVSLTVGEKEGASALIKEWLEDNPNKKEETEEGEGE